MTVIGKAQFYVTDSPFQTDEMNIANIHAAGYDPTDRERLFLRYHPAAGHITLDPQTNMYGRANKFGGNYNFDPNGDYLNSQGWFGQGSSSPIRYGGSGLDQPMGPATGVSGAIYNNNLRIGIPRKTATPDNIGGTIQCPYGFYQYNNVCVPGVNMDPTNPANVLGIDTKRGFMNSRGVIKQVITPVKTEFNKLFQLVVKVQNIGNKPGKFFIKVDIPSITLLGIQSNSIFLNEGQEGVIYQSLQMPASVAPNTLLSVKTDLWKQDLNAPYAEPTLEDTNTATLPHPTTTLGMPPLPPPLPNFPIPPMIPGGRAFNAYEYPAQYYLSPPVPPAIPYMAPHYQPVYPMYYSRRPAISIHPPSFNNSYQEGQQIMVSAIGFQPGEPVFYQWYSNRSIMGIVRFNNKLGKTVRTQAMFNGMTQPVWLTVPNAKRNSNVSLVAIGTTSNKKISIDISVN